MRGILSDMLRRLNIALFALALSLPLATAQRRGGMGAPAAGARAGFARGVSRGSGLHRGRWPLAGAGFLGSPFLYSDYDSADTYLTGNPENSLESGLPQVVVVQPASAGVAPRQTRLAPLLIEWQGDRYVRFGGAEAKEEHGTAAAHPDFAEPASTKPSASAAQKLAGSPVRTTPQDAPPPVLVFRDGHREEISDYAIADGVIYVRSSNWQNGAWRKSIPLTALDPVATMQANRDRGAKFMLPSAPNVVIASF